MPQRSITPNVNESLQMPLFQVDRPNGVHVELVLSMIQSNRCNAVLPVLHQIRSVVLED